MDYSVCKKRCKTRLISSKEPSISLLLQLYQMYTSKKITNCEEFCKLYVTFLDAGELMFGVMWTKLWRKTINMHRTKIFKCSHCNNLFETRTTTDHILKYLIQQKIIEKVMRK
ncbi:Zn finger protein [Sulfolobales Beppu filamentous virus 2]|uniref:Zn finger protein n=1 Tax=Sulfolobales Beppu filamentous virus 2 TaxID=2493123 RepID=A0A3S8NF21_9VIRU|nr:Zn finger protein [Sulfolobales Beppu filamentous virus 2]AZI75830.1 Zn finger protein [Sulfolobales Beppu filamentous virus 2]